MAPGLTDDRYFSERLVGEVARENQNISEVFWRGFVALVESRSRDGWFSERYPLHCFEAPLPVETASAERIAETKRLARERGRDIEVWTPVGIVCRPTQKEADDYVQYVVDHADWGAIGYLAEMHAKDGRSPTDPQRQQMRSRIERRALARGSYCAIGDPEAVTRELARLRSAGLDGLAVNFVDYLEELPYFAAEVLPRLERLGLRLSASSSG